MKVLHPKVITPKNEGCGFPWHGVYVISIHSTVFHRILFPKGQRGFWSSLAARMLLDGEGFGLLSRWKNPGETYGGFRKWWYLQIIHFNRGFHYKSFILGTTILGNLLITYPPRSLTARPWTMVGKEDKPFRIGFWYIFRGELLNFRWVAFSPIIMEVENHPKWKEPKCWRYTHFPRNHDYGRKGRFRFINTFLGFEERHWHVVFV